MANELKHATVGGSLSQAEWGSIVAHILDAQATGDLVYASSAAQLRRLGIGSQGQLLRTSGGIPSWTDPAGVGLDYGLSFQAIVTTYTDTTHFKASGLTGKGSSFFNGYYAYVVWDAGGAGAAPQGEAVAISDYVSADGTFTHTAFTTPLAVTDEVIIIHPYLWYLLELKSTNIPADIDTLLARLTAARAGYLDELAAANLPADIDTLLARLTAARAGYLDTIEPIQQAVHGQPALVQATFTGNLANVGSATLVALDALGGAMRDIRVKVFISSAVAGLGITPGWYATRYAALGTFTQQTAPSLGAQHAPAAAVVEDYEVGDLPEGLQGELRIASAGNDSALTFEATVSYEQ